MTTRKFIAEGALHLFSGLPTTLSPADVFHAVDDDQLRTALEGCNIYIVTCRQRIWIDRESIHVTEDMVSGLLHVARDRWTTLPFKFRLSYEHHLNQLESLKVTVSTEGTHLVVERKASTVTIPAYVIIAQAECNLNESERDLNVMYVGQSVGRTRSRLAIDRLSNHATLQRILADVHTYNPHTEIILLLYRFDQSQIIISTGGDLNLSPMASGQQDADHFRQLSNASVGRRARISLAEAALINYFQPKYNKVFMRTNFATQRKLKLLREVLDQDLTGLIVEICSHTLGSRLRSETRAPMELDAAIIAGYQRLAAEDKELSERAREELTQMQHTHHADFPLTNADERDTFLHGTRWIGANERQPML